MKIRSVRCVEYTGTMEHPDEFWEERLIRPVDIYRGFQAQGPESLPRAGASAYRIDSVFVHIDVDTGEHGTAGPITRGQAHHILTSMAPLLVGQDPLATERLWDQLYRFSVHGRKGVEMQAISALDCALWDFKGKHFGVPVHVLLGGPVREEIPAYASALGYSLEPDRVRARAARFVQDGFRATKWFPRWGPANGRSGMARNEELVRALREAVGPETDIMIDAWMSWDVPYTLRMAERLRDYAPHWIEEPVLPDKIDSYAEITAGMPHAILVAGGEHEYTRWGLGKLMAVRAMHVFQPDTYWAGGISEMLKIATLASTHDVILIPHGHSVPANAHLSFALPVSLVPMLEYLVKWNRVHQFFLAHPVHPVNGVVHPPQQPGLGMELDEDKIGGRTELRP
jgi:L-rhamnonate dehydratase